MPVMGGRLLGFSWASHTSGRDRTAIASMGQGLARGPLGLFVKTSPNQLFEVGKQGWNGVL